MSLNDKQIVALTGFGVVNTPEVPVGNVYKHVLGIELELENADIDSDHPPRGWDTHRDDSLRNGIELVLSPPRNGLQLYAAIESFYSKDYDFTRGPRTSTHIHVNMTEQKICDLRTMFVIMYMIEDSLFTALEAKRKWAGYCMPLSEMSPHRVRKILTADDRQEFKTVATGRNPEKYYGFNINSIYKHGTVELRYFPGGPTKKELLEWVVFANELKTAALQVTMDRLVSLSTVEQVVEFVSVNFPTWGSRLIAARGPEIILQALNDVTSLTVEDDGAARRDALVFVTPALLNFYSNTVFTQPQMNALTKAIKGLDVMTKGEWYAHTTAAAHCSADSDEGYYMPDTYSDEVVAPRPLRTYTSTVPLTASTTERVVWGANSSTSAPTPTDAPDVVDLERNTEPTSAQIQNYFNQLTPSQQRLQSYSRIVSHIRSLNEVSNITNTPFRYMEGQN